MATLEQRGSRRRGGSASGSVGEGAADPRSAWLVLWIYGCHFIRQQQKLFTRVDKSMCCMQQTDAPMQQICQSFVARQYKHTPYTHRRTQTVCSCHLSGCRLKRRLPRAAFAVKLILKINRAEGIICLSLSLSLSSLLSLSLSLTIWLSACYSADMLIKTIP